MLESIRSKLQLSRQLGCQEPAPVFIPQKFSSSAALLRMACTRLSFDTDPGRALDTQDPVQIARATL